MQVKTKDFVLEGEGNFTARVNPKLKTLSQLASGEFEKMLEALGDLLLSWDFKDENGEPMASPTKESVEELPIDAATKITELLNEAINDISKKTS